MNVLNRDLKAIKEFCLGVLNFRYKMLGQVFIHDAITGCKKCQHMGDKMTLTVIEVLPIRQVLTQINFFCSPETCFCLFIEFPDVMMLNREEYKAVFVLF